MDDPLMRAPATVPQTDLWQATAVGSFLAFFFSFLKKLDFQLLVLQIRSSPFIFFFAWGNSMVLLVY